MFRRAAALVLAIAVSTGLLTGCGGGKKAPTAAGARAQALSYVPADAPLVALVSTDIDHGQGAVAKALVHHFPGSALVLAQLESRLESNTGLTYGDIRPLLGNEIVLSVPSAAALSSHTAPQITWVTRDGGKLAKAVSKVAKRGGLRGAGSYRGAALYVGPLVGVAVRGADLVVAPSAAAVRAALDQRARGGGLTPGQLGAQLRGFTGPGLARVTGDAGALLRAIRPPTAALRVPWVAALGRFGGALTATSSGLQVRFRVDTSGGDIVDPDVPIATGTGGPAPAGSAPLVVALRNAAHIIAFAERAAEHVVPKQFAAFRTAEATIRAATGVDLDGQVVQQLTRTTTIKIGRASCRERV